MGLIEDNSDNIAHLVLDEADLEFSGFTITPGSQSRVATRQAGLEAPMT